MSAALPCLVLSCLVLSCLALLSLQVAASMVMDLVGPHCDEVVACAYIRPDWPHKDPAELCMEATLLVVEDPAAAEEKEGEGETRPPTITSGTFG